MLQPVSVLHRGSVESSPSQVQRGTAASQSTKGISKLPRCRAARCLSRQCCSREPASLGGQAGLPGWAEPSSSIHQHYAKNWPCIFIPPALRHPAGIRMARPAQLLLLKADRLGRCVTTLTTLPGGRLLAETRVSSVPQGQHWGQALLTS